MVTLAFYHSGKVYYGFKIHRCTMAVEVTLHMALSTTDQTRINFPLFVKI